MRFHWNMHSPRLLRLGFLLVAGTGAIVIACGGSDESTGATDVDAGTGIGDGGRGLEQTGQECKVASECYGGVDGGVDGGGISGTVLCLDRVTNGYCTHLCNDDSDCCKAPGECKTGLKQVCSPFESTGQKMCFLSCEDGDVTAGIAAQAADGGYDGGALDSGSREDAYCKSYASTAFGCRSTGGGKANRKVCLP